MSTTDAAETAALPEIATRKQVAEYLQVTTTSLFRWEAEGTGPRLHRIGRAVRYRRADVDAWVESGGAAA